MNLNPFKSKIKRKAEDFVKSVQDFSLQNKNALCIIADPKTNAVIVTYKGLIASLRNKGGQTTIKDIIYLKSDDKSREKALNQFFQELDGALFAISEQMYNARLGGKENVNKLMEDMMKVGTHEKNEKGNTKEIVALN